MLSADAIHSLITSSLKVSRPSLKFLFLADCHLPSQTLRLIATQCGNRLKQLDLFRASLDPHDPDQDLEDLFSGCKSLRYLNLCNLLCNTTHYRIDASILDQLASGMPKLQTLYVDLSRMSEVRANQFVEKFQASHPKAIIRQVRLFFFFISVKLIIFSIFQYGRSQAYDYLYIGEQNWKSEQHGKGKTVWHTGTTYEGRISPYYYPTLAVTHSQSVNYRRLERRQNAWGGNLSMAEWTMLFGRMEARCYGWQRSVHLFEWG